MFCDITSIHVCAGSGGNGAIAFRKEKFIPRGGPNGGDGGQGGDIIFKGNENLNSLIELHTKKHFKAQNGEGGGGWQKHGKSGDPLIIEVPVGTLIKDEEGTVLHDITEHNQEIIIVQGGRGGYGNEHFKSSTRQTPRFGELGEPGEEKDLTLELKLVADIGIIGIPSAGKSTLINALTAAKAEVGDYPFTTLIPNLGVAKVHDSSLVIADIPGLIEGGSEGKGLGCEFLRHISRNSILIHVVDVNDDMVKNYKIIQTELKKYSQELAKKKQIIALNKIDSDDAELMTLLEADFRAQAKIPKSTKVFCISSLLHIGLVPLLNECYHAVQALKSKQATLAVAESAKKEAVVYTPLFEEHPRDFAISEIDNKGNTLHTLDDTVVYEERTEHISRYFRVEGKRINQIAIMTDFTNAEALDRLWDVFLKIGVWRKLESLGAISGDRVCFERFEGSIHYREKLY